MQLQPRTFIYKRKQKSRKIYFFKKNISLHNFGSACVILLKPVFLTAKNLFRLKLFFKRASKKPDFTRRFVWLNAFPHLPLTKKPTGTRMGKGKGKLGSWYTHVHPGVSFCEFKNLRPGRALYFSSQLHHKLGIDVKISFQTNTRMPFPLSLSQTFKHTVRW